MGKPATARVTVYFVTRTIRQDKRKVVYRAWRGKYSEVLPRLPREFNNSLEVLAHSIPDAIERGRTQIQKMCRETGAPLDSEVFGAPTKGSRRLYPYDAKKQLHQRGPVSKAWKQSFGPHPDWISGSRKPPK